MLLKLVATATEVIEKPKSTEEQPRLERSKRLVHFSVFIYD